LVFFVNLPVGVVSLLFVRAFLPHLRRPRSTLPVKLDWVGAIVLASTFGVLQLLIEWAPSDGITPTTCVLALLTAGGAAVLLFWEKRMALPDCSRRHADGSKARRAVRHVRARRLLALLAGLLRALAVPGRLRDVSARLPAC